MQDEDRYACGIAGLHPEYPLAVADIQQALVERSYIGIKHLAATHRRQGQTSLFPDVA